MRKGQTGLGLVLLGVVAIIAVIGLVLLFTRASAPSGQAITDLSIGNTYGGGTTGSPAGYGIDQPAASPAWYRNAQGYGVPAQPEIAYPSYGDYPVAVRTEGSRAPAFIVEGYSSIEDLYACERDLQKAGVPVPHDQFNCYTVPVKGASPEVRGLFPPASSAQNFPYNQPHADPAQKSTWISKQGGRVLCYANSVGAEQQVPNSEDLIRENVVSKLVDNNVGVEKYPWNDAYYNNKRIGICWASLREFPFPQ